MFSPSLFPLIQINTGEEWSKRTVGGKITHSFRTEIKTDLIVLIKSKLKQLAAPGSCFYSDLQMTQIVLIVTVTVNLLKNEIMPVWILVLNKGRMQLICDIYESSAGHLLRMLNEKLNNWDMQLLCTAQRKSNVRKR